MPSSAIIGDSPAIFGIDRLSGWFSAPSVSEDVWTNYRAWFGFGLGRTICRSCNVQVRGVNVHIEAVPIRTLEVEAGDIKDTPYDPDFEIYEEQTVSEAAGGFAPDIKSEEKGCKGWTGHPFKITEQSKIWDPPFERITEFRVRLDFNPSPLSTRYICPTEELPGIFVEVMGWLDDCGIVPNAIQLPFEDFRVRRLDITADISGVIDIDKTLRLLATELPSSAIEQREFTDVKTNELQSLYRTHGAGLVRMYNKRAQLLSKKLPVDDVGPDVLRFEAELLGDGCVDANLGTLDLVIPETVDRYGREMWEWNRCDARLIYQPDIIMDAVDKIFPRHSHLKQRYDLIGYLVDGQQRLQNRKTDLRYRKLVEQAGLENVRRTLPLRALSLMLEPTPQCVITEVDARVEAMNEVDIVFDNLQLLLKEKLYEQAEELIALRRQDISALKGVQVEERQAIAEGRTPPSVYTQPPPAPYVPYTQAEKRAARVEEEFRVMMIADPDF